MTYMINKIEANASNSIQTITKTDAINLMHLYDSFLTKKGILRDEYIKTLKKSPAIPNAYRKVIKKLESNEKVTYKDFITYIDEDLR